MGGGNEQWYRMFGRYPSGRKIEGEEGCGSVMLKALIFAVIVMVGLAVIIQWVKPAAAYTLEQRTFQATIIQVQDGDSVIVHIEGWPLVFDHLQVRLEGIDSPESRKNDARCIKELKLGLIAKAWMKAKLPPGTKVKVVWSGEKEKFGRLLAVIMIGTENINKTLVRLGHAVEYHGATKGSWC